MVTLQNVLTFWGVTSQHDLPAYGIFCGWCTHGKFPCPTCKATLQFIWLRKGASIRRLTNIDNSFLLTNHLEETLRTSQKDVVVIEPAPQMLTGAVLHAQIDALQVNEADGYVGYGEKHAWPQISGLWRLPYINDLLLPHNIDVMHTEKNWGKALFRNSHP